MAVDLPGSSPPKFTPAGPLSIAGYARSTLARGGAGAAVPWSRLGDRLLEIVPGATALLLISSLVWGFIWFPTTIAVALLAFDLYWLWKSWTIAYHVVKGVRLMRRSLATDWRAAYDRAVASGTPALAWQDIRHLVVIPNYGEAEEKLRATLTALAGASGAGTAIIPVLAMEAREADAPRKAEALLAGFEGAFAQMLVTFHPAGLKGEVRGKSSNESWAARQAAEELVRQGHDLDLLTVTSCDADTIFPRQYFDCLAYNFAVNPDRYRRFWQAPIFFYNNIWQVPAPLRVPNALGGLIHLSRLSRRRRVLFSQSTYSLSLRMADDVGYWDTDVIPEDWHMFLKCFYQLGGGVEVEPIHLPVGNDGALARGPRASFVNHYLQVQRWAWGASDILYAVRSSLGCREIPARRRLLRIWYLFENHLMWSTQWFFITLGGLIPWLYDHLGGAQLIPDWFYLDQLLPFDTYLPGWVTITTLILTPCLIPYAVLILNDWRLRPAAPRHLGRLHHLRAHLCWLAVSPITFAFSALPALDSQVRLMLGHRMEYRVTEKL